MSQNPYRLPRTVIPSRYELTLEPDLRAHTFTGSERIQVDITSPTQEIVLNAAEIDVSRATLVQADGAAREATVSYDEPLQRVSLGFGELLPTGEASLEIDFTGVLNDQLHGFYRSTYSDVDGVDQTVAATQFEAASARRAFPCWDEPDLKATFAVTLVVPEGLMAVSNSAERSRETLDDGRVGVRFDETMRMSTYLVAFVVGPFTATEPVDVDGIPMRVITPKGKEHLAPYALECGEFCFRYLRDYYGIPYPGDKVDMVAIPDFAFGAMENLGCITFRETALLVDPETATQAELARIVDVVGHELAHMWFGDLVTMRWWDGIWLNEAFASFMEMKATDAMRPDWKRWLAFGAVERPGAFAVDALESTRPVEFECGSPEEADEMFDALTYGKGSSVLRMIEQYLGEEVFRQGVGDYLRRHAYGNTVTSDLWTSLDASSGIPVGEVMDTWILQGGYPQIQIEQTGDVLRLSQSRFLSIPNDSDQTLWRIPVQIRGESDGRAFEARLIMDGPSATVPVDGPIDWVVGNAGGHGFYRVAYEPTLAKALLSQMDRLTDLERYCLIDDAWAFVECGRMSAAAFLELAGAYRHETEQSVWSAVIGGVAAIRHHLVADEQLAAFRAIVSELLAPAMARVGWEPGPGDSDLTRRLRGQIIGALGRLADDPDVVARCRDIASRWLGEQRGIDPDVAQASLFTTAAHGDEDEYERIFSMYRSSRTPQTQLKLLQALTFFDVEELVDKTVSAVVDGRIRSQDSAWVVARLLAARDTGPYAWRQVRREWSSVTSTMPPMTIRRMVEGLPALSRPDVAADVQAFLSETTLPTAAKAIRQNLERLLANVLMREREREPLARHLERR